MHFVILGEFLHLRWCDPPRSILTPGVAEDPQRQTQHHVGVLEDGSPQLQAVNPSTDAAVEVPPKPSGNTSRNDILNVQLLGNYYMLSGPLSSHLSQHAFGKIMRERWNWVFFCSWLGSAGRVCLVSQKPNRSGPCPSARVCHLCTVFDLPDPQRDPSNRWDG